MDKPDRLIQGMAAYGDFRILAAQTTNMVEVARIHADLLRAVATGDEEEAAAASDRQIDFAESFTKRIITRDF